jgi:hypothetical protein
MLAAQTGDEPRFEVLNRVLEELNLESGKLYIPFQSIFRITKGVMRWSEEGYSEAAEYDNASLEMK